MAFDIDHLPCAYKQSLKGVTHRYGIRAYLFFASTVTTENTRKIIDPPSYFFLVGEAKTTFESAIVKNAVAGVMNKMGHKRGHLAPTECGGSLRLAFPSSERHLWL